MHEIMSTQNRTQEHDIHHTISGGMVDTASTLWSTLPHSLAAGRVQLKLLENAIFKAEQELEAWNWWCWMWTWMELWSTNNSCNIQKSSLV